MVAEDTDVVVIGGGLLGCAASSYLARSGVEVVLLERSELNREASGTNAGSLHIQLLRPPRPEMEWLDSYRPMVQMHINAARAWRGLEDDIHASVGVRMRGGLLLAETEEQVRVLEKKVAVEQDSGMDTHLVDGDEARVLCPLLSDAVIAADYCPDDGIANSLLVAPALAQSAADNGARVRVQHEVQAIQTLDAGGFLVSTSKGSVRAKRVVNAAGGWAGKVAQMVGVQLPISPDVLQMSVTEAQPSELDLLIQHIGRRLTLKQAASGTYIIGGGWGGGIEAASGLKFPEFDSIAGNMWAAVTVIPRLARVRVTRSWAGMGANTPDWRPIVGECDGVPGFFTLFAGLGFTLGLVCAQQLVDRMTSPRDMRTTMVPKDDAVAPAGPTREERSR